MGVPEDGREVLVLNELGCKNSNKNSHDQFFFFFALIKRAILSVFSVSFYDFIVKKNKKAHAYCENEFIFVILQRI